MHTRYKRLTSLTLIVMMNLSVSTQASARILFEDDIFFNINSEGIILDFNNDVGSNAENISVQLGNDGTDASIDYAGDTGDITLSTPGGDFDFSDDNLTTTGALKFGGSSEFHLREVVDEAAADCTTVDEIVLDTSENAIYVCTVVGAPGTWTSASSSTDLQGAYDADASGAHEILLTTGDGQAVEIRANANGDDLLQLQNSAAANLLNLQDLGGTTIDINSLVVDWDAVGAFDLDSTSSVSIGAVGTASDFTLASNSAADDLTIAVTGATDSSVVINSSGTGADAIDLNATAGGITIDTAGAWSIQGANNSDLTTTGTSDISFIAGDDLIFDDAQLTGVVQLTDAATDFAATFSTDGIIDNLNSFTLTTTGNGASNVGIEDAGTYFTGTDVEAALQELGISIGNNYQDLTFYPEYPDSVAHADGTNNQGTLESFYDDTEDTNYYRWMSQQATVQDVDIRFQFPLPTDFSATGNFTYRFRTGTVTEADNDVEVTLFNVTDTATCGSDTTNGSANAWATGTIAAATIDAGCTGADTLDAGDVVEVQIKLLDLTGGGTFADMGRVTWNYTK